MISGKIQMHTSTPFAEDLLVTSRDELPPGSGRHLWFIVPVNAPGLRVVSRRIAARHQNRFISPLSSRFDELDSMVWMDNVFIPRSRVFTGETIDRNRRHSLVGWLLWHHSYGWLAKAELTLGIALALAEVMGLKENQQTIEQLVELTVNVQITRTCLTAAETGPGDDSKRQCPAQSAAYRLLGNQHHAGAPANERDPAWPSRIVAGQTPRQTPILPTQRWLTNWRTLSGAAATQRCSGPRYCNWLGTRWRRDWTGGRQSSRCTPAAGWMHGRRQVAAWFPNYNELANGVQSFLNVDIPPLDLSGLQDVPAPTAPHAPCQPLAAEFPLP